MDSIVFLLYFSVFMLGCMFSLIAALLLDELSITLLLGLITYMALGFSIGLGLGMIGRENE